MQFKYDALEIISRVYDNEEYEVNICRSYDDDKSLYTVICLKDVDLFKEEIKFFSQLREKKKFTDFVACFSKNSFLYILFIYHDEAPMLFKELYEKSIIERANFIKAILSYIIVSDIPEIMLWDLLSKENINIDKSGKVYFNYFLKSIERYAQYGQKRYMKKLSNMLLEIFSEEINENKLQGISSIIDKLKSQTYSCAMEIYLDFVSLYDEFNSCAHTEGDEEITFISKIKKFLKSIKEKWGLTIITAILSAAVVVFIVMSTTEKQPKNISKIEKIGTREIK